MGGNGRVGRFRITRRVVSVKKLVSGSLLNYRIHMTLTIRSLSWIKICHYQCAHSKSDSETERGLQRSGACNGAGRATTSSVTDQVDLADCPPALGQLGLKLPASRYGI